MAPRTKSPPKKPGRPSPYKPEYATIAQKLCGNGATDIEIADVLGVDVRTIYRWKNEHDEFCQALVVGKGQPDERVKRSLFQRAVGYSFESEKVFQHKGKIIRAPVVEHVPPDTAAAINWLINRDPTWKNRLDHGGTAPDGGIIVHVTSDDEKLA